MDEVSAAARIGQTIGPYRLTALRGQGGFGAVYEGVDASGTKVAVKVLHPRLVGDKEVLTRFRREARAAAAIGHPNIVEVIDTGEDDKDAWIAMELLEGRDATAVLNEEGPFPLGRAVRVAQQVCDALSAAHATGIVHRDLKLDNIFFCHDQSIKLLDFGVSKFLDAVDGASLMTRTGTTIGTPFYMSPEQAQGKKDIDARADIYSLAVILFKLLTGQHPFEDESFPMLVLKICTEPPPPITRYRADVPPAFEAVLNRMLEKTADARYANCDQVRQALQPFADHDREPKIRDDAPKTAQARAAALTMGAAPTALSIDPITGKPLVPALEEEAMKAQRAVNSTGGGKWLGLVLVLLVGAGVGGWWFTQDEPDPEPEPEPVARLPQPAAPLVQPMRAPEGAELGWRWVNPMPFAMPTWNDVEVGGPGLVAMVGDRGQAGRIVNDALQDWPSGVEVDLHAIDWIGPAQAIAVGDAGTAVVLLMTGPRALTTSVEADLRDVSAIGTTNAIVVGDEGTIVRFPGLRPTPVSSGRDEHLFGVHVKEDTAWAVGQRGLILRIEGDQVSVEREPSGPSLRAVGGCGDALYAVGDERTVYRRSDTGQWSRVNVEPREDWTDVACDRGRVVASGSKGGVLMLSGDRSVRIDSGGERGIRGVGAAEGSPTWLVGDGGFLAQVQRNRLRILTAGHTGTLFDLATLGGSLVTTGRWGAVLRFDGQRLVAAESPTDAALTAMTLLEQDRLLAVGDHGTLVEITWDAVRTLEGPGDHGWRDVISHEGMLVAVGSDGAVLRGTPGALTVTNLADLEGGLWAIDGSVDDAWAVGDAGTVVQLAASSGRVVTRCGEGTLRGIWVEESGAWIVGDAGVYRLEGEDCSVAHEGGPLFDVAVGPHGRPLAVGAEGRALERDQEGTWQRLETGTRYELRAIHETDRDIYVVGAGGVVLRHPKLH